MKIGPYMKFLPRILPTVGHREGPPKKMSGAVGPRPQITVLYLPLSVDVIATR